MSKAKKPHIEKCWCIKYTRKKDGKIYFGGMITDLRRNLSIIRCEAFTASKVRVLVTEIKPKRKAKR